MKQKNLALRNYKAEPNYYTKERTSDKEDYDNESIYDITETKCDIADTYYTQDKYRSSHNCKSKHQYQNSIQ